MSRRLRGIVLRPVHSRRLRRLASLAAVSALLVACGGTATPTSTTSTPFVASTTTPPAPPTTGVVAAPDVTGTLIVWADSAIADAVRSRAALFTADTGIEVVVDPMAEADILNALLEGGDVSPDVFIGPHTWLYRLAVAGITEPVELADGLPAGVVEAVSLRTFPLGVPVAVDAIAQIRNPSLVASRPTSAESIDCSGCFVLPADGDLDVTYPFIATLGAYVFGPDPATGYAADDTTVDSDEAIAAAAVLEAMVASGVIDPASDRANALARFEAGAAGIIWAGPEAIGLVAGESVEALPTLGDSPGVSPVRVVTAYVNARGTLKPEAGRFAEQYLGDQDGSRAFADALGMAPVWAAVATDDELVFIEAAITGDPVPYAVETEAAWAEVSAAFARILLGTAAETALLDAGDAIRFGRYGDEDGDVVG